jgi:hypothetical protein
MKRWSLPAVVTCVAVGLVLVAGSSAATRYLITSKGQIAPRVIKQLQGARGLRGPRGATGATGAAGVAGAAGTFNAGDTQTVAGSLVYIAPNSKVYANAACPSGSVAISGGYNVSNGAVTTDERSSDGTGWYIWTQTGSSAGEEQAFAVCAS